MKTTTIALTLLTACSGDADIGIDSTPVTCTLDRTADVTGSVRDPGNGNQFAFDTATPTATATTGSTSLQLAGGDTPDAASVILRFGFYCGPAAVQTYGVAPDDQSGLDCPNEVAGVVLGRIEYLPAQSGTLIIDETSNCLAGRFRVDFGDNGEVSGSFSAPWQ